MNPDTPQLVSDCCKADMIPPDWDAMEEAGSLWRAYAYYICKKCSKACKPVPHEINNKEPSY